MRSMNAFDVLDVALSGREQRKHADLTDVTAVALDRIYNALDQRDPRVRSNPETVPVASVEGLSPTDGPRTARAIDPNYCNKCTPKGYGYCRCEIASNE